MDNVEHLESFLSKPAITPPISRQNELKTMKMLLRLCWKSLAGYPRTLKGDIDMLQRDDLTTNMRNSLMFTIYEKNALNSLIEFADWVSDALMMEPSIAIKAIGNTDFRERPELGEYVQAELLPLLERESENRHN